MLERDESYHNARIGQTVGQTDRQKKRDGRTDKQTAWISMTNSLHTINQTTMKHHQRD